MLTVIIPVFNEEASVIETLNIIHSVLSNQNIEYEIIAVDDGSTDRTKELLKDRDDIILISRDINRGYGFSIK